MNRISMILGETHACAFGAKAVCVRRSRSEIAMTNVVTHRTRSQSCQAPTDKTRLRAYKVAGLAAVTFLPALFWVSVVAFVTQLFGFSVSSSMLFMTGCAIVLFLGPFVHCSFLPSRCWRSDRGGCVRRMDAGPDSLRLADRLAGKIRVLSQISSDLRYRVGFGGCAGWPMASAGAGVCGQCSQAPEPLSTLIALRRVWRRPGCLRNAIATNLPDSGMT
jgi:hypothetical protein